MAGREAIANGARTRDGAAFRCEQSAVARRVVPRLQAHPHGRTSAPLRLHRATPRSHTARLPVVGQRVLDFGRAAPGAAARAAGQTPATRRRIAPCDASSRHSRSTSADSARPRPRGPVPCRAAPRDCSPMPGIAVLRRERSDRTPKRLEALQRRSREPGYVAICPFVCSRRSSTGPGRRRPTAGGQARLACGSPCHARRSLADENRRGRGLFGRLFSCRGVF